MLKDHVLSGTDVLPDVYAALAFLLVHDQLH
jgi:hypothetical protein